MISHPLPVIQFSTISLPSIIVHTVLRYHPVIFKLFCTLCLFTILVLVLLLPLLSKKISRNMEPFFLLMGILALTISHFLSGGISGWSSEIVVNALKAPLFIDSIPFGIFQVVLIAGLVLSLFYKPFYNFIDSAIKKMGVPVFLFLLIVGLSLVSSIISVIVASVILSEVMVVLPLERDKKINATIIACFALGLGAVLTPIGEPLSLITIAKLSGEPYYAGFTFMFSLLGRYVLPCIIFIALFGAIYSTRGVSINNIEMTADHDPESIKTVLWRSIKIYLFIAGLTFLGEGLMPLVIWYFSKLPPVLLYWINMISAVLDNATLASAEIGPNLSILQIKSALMGLLISGGMLIPGNIPNILCADKLKISGKKWAKLGIPMGLVLMVVFFLILFLPTWL